MKVSLPNDAWANIRSRGEISERVSRQVSRAVVNSSAVAAKLNKLGFNDDDPNTYDAFKGLTDEEQVELNYVQTALIIGFVSSWSYESAIDAESVLDLPSPVYQELASACLKEYANTGETDELDPKAPTGDSPA